MAEQNQYEIDCVKRHCFVDLSDLESVVKQHIFHFSVYDFLWKDDMQGNYTDFISHDPGSAAIQREVYQMVPKNNPEKDFLNKFKSGICPLKRDLILYFF